jgi:hypothetical protein
MTFDQIPAGAAVFLDANTPIYHFAADPKYGAACTRLLKRIENQDIQGFTSANVLADVAHRLMTLEAMARLGWPATRLAALAEATRGDSQAGTLSAGAGQAGSDRPPSFSPFSALGPGGSEL